MTCLKHSYFSKIKALALVPFYCGYTGGPTNERQILNLLADKIDKLTVISLISISQIKIVKSCSKVKPRNLRLIFIPTIDILSPIFQLLVSFLSVFTLLIFNKDKDLHLIYIREAWLAFFFVLSGRLNKKTVIKAPSALDENIKMRNKMLYKLFRYVTIRLYKFVLLQSQYVATYSKLMAERLEKRLSIKIKNIIILPPGIDLRIVEYLRHRSIQNIEQKSSFRIGFVGWLTEWQGLDILLDAIKGLKERIPNAELFIVGDGPLRKIIEKTCEKENIKYVITGFVDHEKALEYMTYLDVLVVPRRKSDTIESVVPLKVIEALALGIPVVVTEQKVYHEYGFRNHESIIFCEQDPQDISSAILMLLNNQGLKEKLKINGIKMAKSFGYEEMINKLMKVAVLDTNN